MCVCVRPSRKSYGERFIRFFWFFASSHVSIIEEKWRSPILKKKSGFPKIWENPSKIGVYRHLCKIGSNDFLGGAPTSISHFFRPSVLPSVRPSVTPCNSWTKYDMSMIFGTHVQNHNISARDFSFFKNFDFSGHKWGKRGKNGPKWAKSLSGIYLRNKMWYDCDFWYTSTKQ